MAAPGETKRLITAIDIDGQSKSTLTAMVTSRNIAEALHRKYPGYLWAVEPSLDESVYQIRCMSLSGRWGFIVHATKDTGAKRIQQLGGELLERYRVRRGRINDDEIMAASVDFTGQRSADRG